MAWCCQATSHYLSQCCPSSMMPYGVTGPNELSTSPIYIWSSLAMTDVLASNGARPSAHTKPVFCPRFGEMGTDDPYHWKIWGHWKLFCGHLCYIAIHKSQICGYMGPYSQNNWGHSWFQCAKCPQNAKRSLGITLQSWLKIKHVKFLHLTLILYYFSQLDHTKQNQWLRRLATRSLNISQHFHG